MAQFHDSVGNRYASVPPRKNPPGAGKSKNGNKKHGRNLRKPSFLRWKARNPIGKKD